MQVTRSFKQLSDIDLTDELSRLAQRERVSATELVACLEEFDRRRLFLGFGFSSMFGYCRDKRHLTDGAAYTRTEAARASRRFPALLDMLRDGRLSLATACLIAPKLQADTADGLLSAIAFKSKREVEAFLATLHPQPPVPPVIRKLPEHKTATPSPAASPAPAADEPPASFAPSHRRAAFGSALQTAGDDYRGRA